MCAHTVGRSGRGCLGSRSSSSRHPQSDAITVWPVGPFLYRLGTLHWAVRGGEPSLPPAGWRVWRTPGRELKGSAQPQVGARSLPERLRLPGPWVQGRLPQSPAPGGGAGGSGQRDPDLSTCSTRAGCHRCPWGTATVSLRPLGGSEPPFPESPR